jgi:hypothetical protein
MRRADVTFRAFHDPRMKPLFHLYAINRDGFRVTPKESEPDLSRVSRLINERNRFRQPGVQRGVCHGGGSRQRPHLEELTFC